MTVLEAFEKAVRIAEAAPVLVTSVKPGESWQAAYTRCEREQRTEMAEIEAVKDGIGQCVADQDIVKAKLELAVQVLKECQAVLEHPYCQHGLGRCVSPQNSMLIRVRTVLGELTEVNGA